MNEFLFSTLLQNHVSVKLDGDVGIEFMCLDAVETESVAAYTFESSTSL